MRSPILSALLRSTPAAGVSHICGVVQGMELRNFCRGRHFCSAGRPSRWASAHISNSALKHWHFLQQVGPGSFSHCLLTYCKTIVLVFVVLWLQWRCLSLKLVTVLSRSNPRCVGSSHVLTPVSHQMSLPRKNVSTPSLRTTLGC